MFDVPSPRSWAASPWPACWARLAPMAQTAAGIDIPYKKFVLKNGLTLLVHEDHKAPIVAVNVWYHVGSKNEKPGRTGFAHLFEHLMFNGSENFNDDYFKVLERLGATDLNGTTNEDRTNYFQNVPTSALDTVLWMESDRMGHLLGAITQAKLDEQRGVVQNEKRQGENEPYGTRRPRDDRGDLPEGPPVLVDGHRLDGGPERGLARRREGVVRRLLRRGQRRHRAGRRHRRGDGAPEGRDSTSATSRRARPSPSTRPGSPSAPASSARSWRTACPQARLYMVWNVPQWGIGRRGPPRPGGATSCSSGKTSRLYKRLVYDEQIATSVSASLDAREIASQFYIMATVAARRRPGEGGAGHSRGARGAAEGRPDGGRAGARARRSAARRSSAASSASAASAASPTCWRRARCTPATRRPTRLTLAARRRRDARCRARRRRAAGSPTACTCSRCSRSPSTRPRPPRSIAPPCRSRARRPPCRFPAFERATLGNGMKRHRRRAPVGAAGEPDAAGRLRATPPTSSRCRARPASPST